jgi:hypothetical protein
MKTKNQIADEIYGVDFADLTSGQKATVTREFNNQEDEDAVDTSDIIYVKIARLGVNGTKECAMSDGSTLGDLLAQSGYTLDSKKEKVVATSTGLAVDEDDILDNGEAYTIMPEVNSA